MAGNQAHPILHPLTETHPLPSTRELITSILTSLFRSPSSPVPIPHHPNIKHDESFNPSTTNQPPSAKAPSHPAFQPETEDDVKNEDYENPLKSLSPSQRALLTTLHVLIPPPTVLQALDLLDRRLITKTIWIKEDEHIDAVESHNTTSDLANQGRPKDATLNQTDVLPSQASKTIKNEEPSTRNTEVLRIIYQVRSSLTSSSSSRNRYRDPSSTSSSSSSYADQLGKVYTVHLDAWNCSCAAFAFSTFPYSSSSSSSSRAGERGGGGGDWRDIFPAEEEEEESDDDEDLNRAHSRHDHGERSINIVDKHGKMEKMKSEIGKEMEGKTNMMREWEYGGLSFDGTGSVRNDVDAAAVPICKHLLAVLLVEKWELVKGFVNVRIVSGEKGREEVAGLAAG